MKRRGYGVALNWREGKLAEGLKLYEVGEFFAAHEEWESVWLTAEGAEKSFLQGVIQVAAAFHHYQRKNLQGTVLLLQAAMGRLEPCEDGAAGICVTELREEIESVLRVLSDGDARQSVKVPRIRPFGRVA